jgi:DNA-binding IclR family transcriptional regulator
MTHTAAVATALGAGAAVGEAPGGVAAVDKALAVLMAFRPGESGLSLTELAARTGLYKSAVLRLLASLAHAGLVQRQGDTGWRPAPTGERPAGDAAGAPMGRGPRGRAGGADWALGPAVLHLHRLYADQNPQAQRRVAALQALVHTTGESAAFYVLHGPAPHRTRLCLHRVDSPHPIRDHLREGDVLPLDRGTGGHVLVAFSPPGRCAVPESADLQGVRAQGHCARVGDRLAEVAGISAPVFGASGALVGALTLTMPAHRYTVDAIAPVRAAAAALSREEGFLG